MRLLGILLHREFLEELLISYFCLKVFFFFFFLKKNGQIVGVLHMML
jgi:hypothetical protein